MALAYITWPLASGTKILADVLPTGEVAFAYKLAQGIEDSADSVLFNTPVGLSPAAGPTIGTAASAQYDSLHTSPIEFTNAATANDGTGQVLGARLISKHATFSGQIRLELFSRSIADSAAQAALTVNATNAVYGLGSILFDFSASNLNGTRVAVGTSPRLPLMYKTSGTQTSLFGFLQLWSSTGVTFAASDLIPHLYALPD